MIKTSRDFGLVILDAGLTVERDTLRVTIERLLSPVTASASTKNKTPDPLVEFWGPVEVAERIKEFRPLALRYFPDEVPEGAGRRINIEGFRRKYAAAFQALRAKIQFVGMSVYKEEATASLDLGDMYIPLRVVGESADEGSPLTPRLDPMNLLERGTRHAILGDPGSGKSTLLKYLALAGSDPKLRGRFQVPADDRLPMLVILRQLADAVKDAANAKRKLNLLDFIVQASADELALAEIDREFFEYYLYAGQALLFFDGIDELPGLEFQREARRLIGEFLDKYPGNTAIVTSRIVGYDAEIRYDTLGFSHHRVARLAMDDIKVFVETWYRLRINNEPERKRHSNDLVRIISDPDSQPIRDLAENPLLLTIICLVHRVDAVLPDERVVLYQKCTETLLNTWHHWRYRTEDTRHRGRVEKQNLDRMEYIAYAMHCAVDASDPTQRSIVTHSQLLDLLASFIEQEERPSTDIPADLADVFVRFVRERAGLLVEVGEGRYSFVHLTFQEYLTASYLRKTGELTGVKIVWTLMQKDGRCENPRWHEVIRLLIGGLTKRESQEFLLKKILSRRPDAKSAELALLAGGCLIDRIQAAEDMADNVIRNLIQATIVSTSSDSLQKLIHLLQVLQERDTEVKNRIAVQSRALVRRHGGDGTRAALVLSLYAMGWTDDEVRASAAPDSLKDANTKRLISVLIGGCPSLGSCFSNQERETLRLAMATLSRYSPSCNLLAAAIISILGRDKASGCVPNLEQLLTMSAMGTGPFAHFMLWTVSLGLSSGGPLAQDRSENIALRRLRGVRAVKILELLDAPWSRARQAKSIENTDTDLKIRKFFMQRILDLSPLLASFENVLLQLAQNIETRLDSGLGEDNRLRFWTYCLGERKLYGPLLEILTTAFALRTPHWSEAIRVRTLPRVPEGITLFEPSVIADTLRAFRAGTPGESDCYHAGAQLLLDAWIYFAELTESPSDSPFRELAALTRDHPSPVLRVAHCLRDMAYGDRSRVADLEKLVESNDPGYRSLFREAFWIE
jgi:hypothetical protein